MSQVLQLVPRALPLFSRVSIKVQSSKFQNEQRCLFCAVYLVSRSQTLSAKARESGFCAFAERVCRFCGENLDARLRSTSIAFSAVFVGDSCYFLSEGKDHPLKRLWVLCTVSFTEAFLNSTLHSIYCALSCCS